MTERINLIMKAKNLSPRQFSEEIGIQPSGLSHIISGRNKPSLDFVMKVVKRFPEIDINWLMFGKGEMYVLNDSTSIPLPQVSVQKDAPRSGLEEVKSRRASAKSQELHSSERVNVESHELVEPDLFTMYEEPAGNFESQKEASASDNNENYLQKPTTIEGKKSEQRISTQTDSDQNKVRKGAPRRISNDTASESEPVDYVVSEGSTKVSEDIKMMASLANGSQKKKVVKFIVLYDDHSFSEYYPEN